MDRAPQRQHRASQGKRPMALQAGGKDLSGGSGERKRERERERERERKTLVKKEEEDKTREKERDGLAGVAGQS